MDINLSINIRDWYTISLYRIYTIYTRYTIRYFENDELLFYWPYVVPNLIDVMAIRYTSLQGCNKMFCDFVSGDGSFETRVFSIQFVCNKVSHFSPRMTDIVSSYDLRVKETCMSALENLVRIEFCVRTCNCGVAYHFRVIKGIYCREKLWHRDDHSNTREAFKIWLSKQIVIDYLWLSIVHRADSIRKIVFMSTFKSNTYIFIDRCDNVCWYEIVCKDLGDACGMSRS